MVYNPHLRHHRTDNATPQSCRDTGTDCMHPLTRAPTVGSQWHGHLLYASSDTGTDCMHARARAPTEWAQAQGHRLHAHKDTGTDYMSAGTRTRRWLPVNTLRIFWKSLSKSIVNKRSIYTCYVKIENNLFLPYLLETLKIQYKYMDIKSS